MRRRYAEIDVSGAAMRFVVADLSWPSVAPGEWIHAPGVRPGDIFDRSNQTWMTASGSPVVNEGAQAMTPIKNAEAIHKAATDISAACAIFAAGDDIPATTLIQVAETLVSASATAEAAMIAIPPARLADLLGAYIVNVPADPAAALASVKATGSLAIGLYIQAVWPLFEGRTLALDPSIVDGAVVGLNGHSQVKLARADLGEMNGAMDALAAAVAPFLS